MSADENILRLIIAEESLNDAEHLVSVLRNAGYAVRPTRVEDDEELLEALNGRAQDLCLCAPGLGGLPLETAIRVLHQAGKDVPLLVLSDTDDSELRAEVMAMGAADLVSKAEQEHFRLSIARELKNLGERRRLRRVEAALRETERRCHALLDSSRDSVAYVHDGMHVYANAAYLERFGVEDFEEIEGLPILDLVAPDDRKRFRDYLRQYARGEQESNRIELSIRTADGEARPVTMEFSTASWDGEECTQILIREQGGEVGLEERLADLRRQDVLTGLFNRHHFLQELDRLIAGALDADDGSGAALLYVQADNLDAIREKLGISAADVVITDMAAIIRNAISEQDIAARYADSAFTVLVPGQSVHEAIGIGEAIRKTMEDHMTEVDGRTVTKSCSVGVAMISDAVSTGHQAINMAYEASSVARRDGGNRVHLHAAEKEGESEGPDWKTRLLDALQNGSFHLLYQPLVSLSEDQTERYEVQPRLVDDETAPVEAGELLPAAEQAGIAPAIDRWVAGRAIAALAARRRAGHETTIFVRISGATLNDPKFLPYVGEQLRSQGVDGAQLVFELSEPVAVTQLKQAKEFYKGVMELRCGFALDQFGSGLNSFQLMKHLPAEYLKLDRSFTVDLAENEETRGKLKELVDNAHSLRRRVIGSHLEEATVLALLWQSQVDLVQGSFLQEPQREMSYDFSGMVI